MLPGNSRLGAPSPVASWETSPESHQLLYKKKGKSSSCLFWEEYSMFAGWWFKTHLKNMLVKLEIFLNFRGEN